MRGKTALLCTIFSASFSIPEEPPLHNVYFASESDVIGAPQQKVLNGIYQLIPPGKTWRIGICGDMKYKKGYLHCNRLSATRAKAVYDYFNGGGITAAGATIRAYRGNHPAPSPDGIYSLALIHFEVEVTKAALWVTHPFKNLQDMYPKSPQCYEFDAGREQNLTFREGTKLSLGKDMFEFENGKKVTGKIRLCIKEYYAIDEILTAGLTTTSHGRILETGGMVRITATSGSMPVKLKEGGYIIIGFPKRGTGFRDMGVFAGDSTKFTLDWVPSGEPVEPPGSGERMESEGEYFRVLDSRAMKTADHYFFVTTGLGWINCDRFYDTPDPVSLTVKADTSVRPVLRLIFRDIKSVLGAYPEGDRFHFERLPRGSKVTLLAYSVTEKEAWYAQKEIVLGKEMVTELALEKTLPGNVKAKFRELSE